MWMKLDDAFFDHPKFFAAGRHLDPTKDGRQIKRGRQRAICVWLAGLGWTNRHYTDGFISDGAIASFGIDDKPLEVATVLAFDDVRLWHRDASRGGYQMHDYHDHNPDAATIKEKLKRDRDRKRKERAEKRNTGVLGTVHADIQPDIQTDSTALARARSRSQPLPLSSHQEDHGRAARAGCGEPVENAKVLKALVWREIHAAYAEGDTWDVASLTERVKVVAAKAKLIYAVDGLCDQIETAMNRVAAQRRSA